VTDRIQLVALGVSLSLLIIVLELVRRRKLTEEYSFLWILCSLALVFLSIRRDVLDTAAHWLGVFYPPTVLLMLLIMMVFIASLCFSVIVSRQRQQIERLIEETAILAAEIRDERVARETHDKSRAPSWNGRPVVETVTQPDSMTETRSRSDHVDPAYPR
jgi:hypothetical protein